MRSLIVLVSSVGPTVEIVDDDLGRSGGGVARPGFDRLIGAICAGGVGAVLAIEASRLARNGRDWHMLIEFCGLVGTILVDEDEIYDPRHPNDRPAARHEGNDERAGDCPCSASAHRKRCARRRGAALFSCVWQPAT